MKLDTRKFKSQPFAHQLEGIEALVKNKAFALFDEMGAGKSKQVIDAACVLAERGEIDTVIVVAPAAVRSVWLDKDFGEIKKHSWGDTHVIEYHANGFQFKWSTYDMRDEDEITWIITNYEFLRSIKNLSTLTKKVHNLNVMLVLDESSYLKSRTAQQTKAIRDLRGHCDRCVLLNGTPVTNSPLDIWSQFQILDPKILSNRYNDNFYHFRSEYAVMRSGRSGGRSFQKCVSFKNLDKLSKLTKPYVLRRLKKDCLDLPEKLYTVREVPLTNESWERYKTLRAEALVELGDGEMQLEPNAGVRLMRLAQLTSGHLGQSNASITGLCTTCDTNHREPQDHPFFSEFQENFTLDVSSEKLDWCVKYLTEECTARAVIVWCRWRRERERLYAELLDRKDIFPSMIFGGQSNEHRRLSIEGFLKDMACRKVMIAQPHAGGFGLNLQVATEAIYLSNDYSLGVRLQSEDRCHRPGQTSNVLYTDVIAVGPKGQQTIDHLITKALRSKEDLSRMTCARWRRELEE